MNDLKEKIQYHLEKPVDMAEKARYRIWIQQKYNWETIAEQTVKVYKEALR
jgi:glycosyltransferase involved in cell wall biosynthesis